MKGEWYLRLSHFSDEDWIEIATLQIDGATSIWANAPLLEGSEGKRAPYTWDEFHTRIIAPFEFFTENEEARKELREYAKWEEWLDTQPNSRNCKVSYLE